MRKKLILLCVSFTLFFLTLSYVSANGSSTSTPLPDDGKYHIVNVDKKGNYTIIKSFATYAKAKVSHTVLQHDYNNLGITLGNRFLTIDQGVVSFNSSDGCSINTEYTMADSGEGGYLNACYGNDGAFLEYNPATDAFKFTISGVTGWVDTSKATLYPVEKLPNVSSFIVKHDTLYHQIKSQATSSTYANTIALSDAPSYLKENKTYYSYDTHYFYTAYKTMIQDYRNNSFKHAINATHPYYNYYQYIDHRSTSAYSPQQLDHYLKDTLALNHTITDFYDRNDYVHDILTQSLLLQGSDAFFQYQNEFGANALMMLSLSFNESALGRSYIAYTKNNLFGHAAFDSSAEKSASRYPQISDSVYSHALHYISESYLNPKAFQYHGGFFGNKAGGMNVSYASDPYWGEKAASYYYKMDAAMGKKDASNYALGISNTNGVPIYATASTKKDRLYTIPKGYDNAFILRKKIKNKEGTWYQVQSDIGLTKNHTPVEDGTYSFTNSYGYVRASDLIQIINEKKMNQKKYVNITFHAAGGSFYPNLRQITLQVEEGKTPVVLPPTRDHALFHGWDITLGPAKEDLTYNATYKAVKDIQLTNTPATKYTIGDTLNLKGGKIRIDFADGTHEEKSLTTDMVSGYQSDVKGKQTLTITYAGTTAKYNIQVSDSLNKQIATLQKQAAYIIKTYTGKTGLNSEAVDEITRFRDQITKITTKPVLQQDQLRIIDRILQENVKPRYSVIIKDPTYDLQVSGLRFALKGETSFLNKIMPKTITLHVSDQIKQKELAQKVAKANNMQIAGYASIDGIDDFSSLKPKSDMTFSIQKPKSDRAHRLYQVYYIDGQDVYQLPTTQTDTRILFTNAHLGEFAIVYQNVNSITENKDIAEVNTIALNGKNYIKHYIIVPSLLLLAFLIACIAYIIHRKKHKKHRLKKKSHPQA